MIRLATLAPDDLNLNGDQGNLLVLQRYFEAAGIDHRVIRIPNGAALQDADFYLIGHGSEDAFRYLSAWLNPVISQIVEQGKLCLAVGSGALAVAGALGISVNSVTERVSEFQLGDYQGLEVLGYRNSDTDLPNMQRVGGSILTMLHGPVLAKNPALLGRLASEIAKRAGKEWKSDTPTLVAHRQKLEQISDRIWRLEIEKGVPLD